MTSLNPVNFTPPEVGPINPCGLYAATTFVETTAAEAARRWLPSGVLVGPINYGTENGFGIWGAPWCVSPDDLDPEDIKTGTRPDHSEIVPWSGTTVYGFDRNLCGDEAMESPTAQVRAEVKARARRNLEMNEETAVSRQFGALLLAQAGTPTEVDDVVEAVGHVEQAFAATGTAGLIHLRAGLLAVAEAAHLVIRDGAALRSPAGHRYVFGGGYAAAPLGDTIIGTSPVFGWRDEIAQRDTMKHSTSEYIAIAERSVLVATEALVAAAEITSA
ncbi:MAG: hypothetical protein ACPGVG_09515 [Mycobacterium sp.]